MTTPDSSATDKKPRMSTRLVPAHGRACQAPGKDLVQELPDSKRSADVGCYDFLNRHTISSLKKTVVNSKKGDNGWPMAGWPTLTNV